MPLTRGQRLRRLREQRRIEIKEAAPAIGISRGYLSLLELGEKGKKLDHVRSTLERAAAYYGVAPEYLLAETPQEYGRAFVSRLGENAPANFGERVRVLLGELQLQWGDDFAEPQVALALGTTVEAFRTYLENSAEITRSTVEQLSAITGAPTNWLVPRPTDPPKVREQIQRFVEKAMASGIAPEELDALLQVWMTAKNAKKPSGI